MHYVCSDIHGQRELYRKMMEAIDLKPEDTLYVIGDVIDRGPDSFGILLDIMNRDNVELFLGNHELMMLDYLRGTGSPGNWFYGNNGGQGTYQDYCLLSDREQQKVLSYLEQAWIQKYLKIDGETYALHHSYFLADKAGRDVRLCEEPDERAVSKAVWYSPYRFFEHVSPKKYDDGCIHLIGHVPVQNFHVSRPPFYNETLGDRLINLDGGCALLAFGYDGGLYCMSLEKDESGTRKEWWFTPEEENE